MEFDSEIRFSDVTVIVGRKWEALDYLKCEEGVTDIVDEAVEVKLVSHHSVTIDFAKNDFPVFANVN
jgi:hypothetical protein